MYLYRMDPLEAYRKLYAKIVGVAMPYIPISVSNIVRPNEVLKIAGSNFDKAKRLIEV